MVLPIGVAGAVTCLEYVEIIRNVIEADYKINTHILWSWWVVWAYLVD